MNPAPPVWPEDRARTAGALSRDLIPCQAAKGLRCEQVPVDSVDPLRRLPGSRRGEEEIVANILVGNVANGRCRPVATSVEIVDISVDVLFRAMELWV